MARTLKTTGVAAKLLYLVAVDDDDTNVIEWVSSTVDTNMTVDTGVTISTGNSWKSTTGWPCWQSKANGGFNMHGVRFGATARPDNTTNGAMIVVSGIIDSGGENWRSFTYQNNGDGLRLAATDGTVGWLRGTGTGAAGDAAHSTGVKMTTASWYPNGGSGTARFWYGLESGSLSLDAATSASGTNIRMPIEAIGGAPGQGNLPVTHFYHAMFTEELTLSEIQGIHDDWENEFFESAGITVTPGKGALTISGKAPTTTVVKRITVTPGKGALSISGKAPTVGAPTTITTLPGKGALTLSGKAPTVAVGANTLTSSVWKNNTGTVQANETGAEVAVLNPTTRTLAHWATSQTTNGSGVWSRTDAANYTSGTEYIVVYKKSDGSLGVETKTAS